MNIKIYKHLTKNNQAEIAKVLKNGGVGIMPSDTIYGIFASSLNQVALEQLYQLRDRNAHKPIIIHISSIDQIK